MSFMLRALEDPEHPYLLLLDENEFSSCGALFRRRFVGMESRHPCLPNLGIGR
jgi:5-methylcytosine-specific restriction protein B